MKIFGALIVLSAFVAYVSAEETQALVVPEAVIRFLDERHYEKMAQVVRDEGMSEDTLNLFANDPAIPTPSQAVERRIVSAVNREWSFCIFA